MGRSLVEAIKEVIAIPITRFPWSSATNYIGIIWYELHRVDDSSRNKTEESRFSRGNCTLNLVLDRFSAIGLLYLGDHVMVVTFSF